MKYLKLFEIHDPDYLNYMNSEDKVLPNLCYCEDLGDTHLNKIIKETRLIIKYNVTDDSELTRLYDYNNINNQILNGINMFNKVEIDDIEVSVSELDAAEGYYQLSEGEHIIKYTLKDPTLTGVTQCDYSTNPPTVLQYGACFGNCSNITEIIIPDNVTSIGDSAFTVCLNLTNINIPNTVTFIGLCAFQFCMNLTSIEIPDNVIEIQENAFSDCDNVSIVKIGRGVTYIGLGAFYSDNAENREYYIYATTPPEIITPFYTPSFTIYVPAESVNAYKTAWPNYSSNIQAMPTI